jgi:hypothetical protein
MSTRAYPFRKAPRKQQTCQSFGNSAAKLIDKRNYFYRSAEEAKEKGDMVAYRDLTERGDYAAADASRNAAYAYYYGDVD